MKESIEKIMTQLEIYEAYLQKIDSPEVLDQVAVKLDFDKPAGGQTQQIEEVKQEPQDTIDTTTAATEGAKPTVDPVIKCNPQPVLILRGNDESYINMVENEGVLLSLSYLNCEYVMSQPNLKTNLAVAESFLNKYTRVGPSTGGTSAAAMIREREEQMQQQAVGGKSSFKDKLVNAAVEDAKVNPQSEQPSELDGPIGGVVRDDNDQW